MCVGVALAAVVIVLLRDLLLCGWSSECWLRWSRYGKMRRRSASRSVCFKTVPRLTWQMDGIQFIATRHSHHHVAARELKQLRELHSPPAPCAAAID